MSVFLDLLRVSAELGVIIEDGVRSEVLDFVCTRDRVSICERDSEKVIRRDRLWEFVIESDLDSVMSCV